MGLRAGMVLALIGVGIAGFDLAGALNQLRLLVVPGVVMVVDVLVFGALEYRWHRGYVGVRGVGWWVVSQFDLFALAFLIAAWGIAGGGFLLAVLFGILGTTTALVGWRWRAQVLTAFLRPASSRLAVVLAVVPALGAGGGGLGLALGRSLAPHGAAMAAVFLVVSLYLLLFAQSVTLKIAAPDWEPLPAVRRQPHRADRARRSGRNATATSDRSARAARDTDPQGT